MISTSTGDMIGCGVKFSRPDPCPSTKIQVRMPSVEPRPSALIKAALIGSTSEPKVRNISSVVTNSTSAIINGMRSSRASMLSFWIVGCPPT
ncbi:Uncharacterised protein [Mycobacteroides abscessus subsp. abscessus]|nr:Uncharacterised protein [Mycobacteroides abscessus subsp. abscessus]